MRSVLDGREGYLGVPAMIQKPIFQHKMREGRQGVLPTGLPRISRGQKIMQALGISGEERFLRLRVAGVMRFSQPTVAFVKTEENIQVCAPLLTKRSASDLVGISLQDSFHGSSLRSMHPQELHIADAINVLQKPVYPIVCPRLAHDYEQNYLLQIAIDAYKLLGVSRIASEDTIFKTYGRLIEASPEAELSQVESLVLLHQWFFAAFCVPL